MKTSKLEPIDYARFEGHTAGPWGLETVPTMQGQGSCHRIGPFPSLGRREKSCACVYADGIRMGIEDVKLGLCPVGDELAANARLIAAAPHHLEQLRARDERIELLEADIAARDGKQKGPYMVCNGILYRPTKKGGACVPVCDVDKVQPMIKELRAKDEEIERLKRHIDALDKNAERLFEQAMGEDL